MLNAYYGSLFDKRRSLIKMMRIMNITAILLLVCGLQLSARVSSQGITLNLKNAPLNKVFEEIKKQTGYTFMYTETMLKEANKVSMNVKNSPLQEVLSICFATQPFTYKIINHTVVVQPKQKVVVYASSIMALPSPPPPVEIQGRVVNQQGEPLQDVSVLIVGTQIGTTTNSDGRFTMTAPDDKNIILDISIVGYQAKRVSVGKQTVINIILEEDIASLSDVVVVGYGTQKKSDVTGSVASLPAERLEGIANINLTQAIQGGISGVLVQTTSAGAEPSESIMIRGRNSIKASNSPLVVIDGVAGSLSDVNPNDVQSVEVLKDASAAAIYGSRGSNGVILVTTKSGKSGETKLKYDGFYGMQRFANLPELLTGEEFYKFKLEREPTSMTPSEQDVYDSGIFADWLDLALRKGVSTSHNLSFSGAFKNTRYYISGGFLNIKGLAVNDDYQKVTTRINVDTKLRNWLTIGTRTQLGYTDASGIAPSFDGDQGAYLYNPLTTPFDVNGDQNINPWPEYVNYRNPLEGVLADNINEGYQVVTNNYAIVDFPFVKGLQYRINTGIRFGLSNDATYYGRNTQRGFRDGGNASTSRGLSKNIVIENIMSYNRDFGKHHVFLTGLYSFENSKSNTNRLSSQGFPNDFLKWYGAEQAALNVPGFSNNETTLLSTMGRINYSYDSRYLLTMTGRSDGYSGFGAKTKRGFFPTMALGWNIVNEDFFKWKDIFSQLKLKASLGVNGNQAVSAYETISRLESRDIVDGTVTLPGYIPSRLGQNNLSWESTRTFNIGLEFGFLNNRITGDINFFKSNTRDLLLDRTISPVSAFDEITQNIGETENRGLEISLVSTNVRTSNFKWETSGNIAFIKNKIVSLYGFKDANGKEVDDLANRWFIGQPIRVNYGYQWIGVWQLDEAAEAAAHQTIPGFIKIRDVSGPDGIPDGKLSPEYDRIIIGQRDPKYTWGMNNAFSYKNLRLSVFVYGIHGMVKENDLQEDNVGRDITQNTIKKNWWTPDNPTNDWVMNRLDANRQQGQSTNAYEDAGFIRLRDVSLSYDFSEKVLSRLGFGKFQVYLSGRNLHTFTKFGGTDPELSGQRAIPLQKEYTIGLNLGF